MTSNRVGVVAVAVALLRVRTLVMARAKVVARARAVARAMAITGMMVQWQGRSWWRW